MLLDPCVTGERRDNSWRQFSKHRNRLVGLGVLARQEFPLSHIGLPSDRAHRLADLAAADFPGCLYDVQIEGYGEATARFIVYDRPEKMKDWEEFIQRHDVPIARVRQGLPAEHQGHSIVP